MKFKLVFLISLVLLSQVVSAQEKGVRNQSVDKLPSENKRWALIIGVDNYRDDISPLYGSVNDAKALKDVLVKNAGFPEKQVILMTTDSTDADLIPNRGNVLDQLDKLSRQIPEEGLLLFSFSGHGVSIGKDAFLIPSDGKIYENPELLRERSIDVLRIRKAIEATKATQVLMLLDACRNDPLKGKGDEPNRLTEAYNNGFSFDTKNKGISAFATIYATSFGDRAFEFLDKQTNKYRGFFSYAIEEGLQGKAANQKGEITLGGLIDYIEKNVKDRVYVEMNKRQVPYPTTEGFNNSNLVLAISRNTPVPEKKDNQTNSEVQTKPRINDPIQKPTKTVKFAEIEQSFKANLFDEAINLGKEYLNLNPDDKTANFYVGISFLNKQETDLSLPFLQKFILLDGSLSFQLKRSDNYGGAVIGAGGFTKDVEVIISKEFLSIKESRTTYKIRIKGLTDLSLRNWENRCPYFQLKGNFTEAKNNSDKTKEGIKEFFIFPNSVYKKEYPNIFSSKYPVPGNECNDQGVYTTTALKLINFFRVDR